MGRKSIGRVGSLGGLSIGRVEHCEGGSIARVGALGGLSIGRGGALSFEVWLRESSWATQTLAAAAHEQRDRTEKCSTSVPGSGAAQRRGHAFKV